MSNMTLAFEYEAFDVLKNPVVVIEESLEWSRYVGIVSHEPQYVVRTYLQDLGVETYPIFYTWLSKRRSLYSIKTEQESERYVLVGASSDAESIADEVNWEYLPVEEAAEKAAWELQESST